MKKKIINFLSVVILSIISLTYIHEIGHAFFAYLNKCDVKSLIFDNGLTAYTVASCSRENALIILGGLLFSSLFSILFLIFGREYFLLSLSLSFLLALEDISHFINQEYVLLFSSMLSFFAYFEFFKKLNERR